MVKQSLITEEAWYAIYSSSLLQEQGEIQNFIRDTYPDATDKQIDKAVLILQKACLKKAKYE
jgi:hypothetical protein